MKITELIKTTEIFAEKASLKQIGDYESYNKMHPNIVKLGI